MRSAELTLPGFIHDVCSSVYPLAIGSPFFRSLPLAQMVWNGSNLRPRLLIHSMTEQLVTKSVQSKRQRRSLALMRRLIESS